MEYWSITTSHEPTALLSTLKGSSCCTVYTLRYNCFQWLISWPLYDSPRMTTTSEIPDANYCHHINYQSTTFMIHEHWLYTGEEQILSGSSMAVSYCHWFQCVWSVLVIIPFYDAVWFIHFYTSPTCISTRITWIHLRKYLNTKLSLIPKFASIFTFCLWMVPHLLSSKLHRIQIIVLLTLYTNKLYVQRK